MKQLVYVAGVLVIFLLGMIGCSQEDGDTQILTVFAASSLTEAFETLGEAFESEHANVEIVFNFAGSSQLAAQISQGAPADIFASANLRQMEIVQESSVITGNIVVFAENQLVIIVPKDNPANIVSLGDLQGENIKLVMAAERVPIREYTEVMLQNASDTPDLGNSFREDVLANIVSEENNVRQIVVKVALGEADAGIVYASDVTADVRDNLQVVAIPAEFNVVAHYYIAHFEDTEQADLATEFIAFIQSEDGQVLIRDWGFSSPSR